MNEDIKTVGNIGLVNQQEAILVDYLKKNKEIADDKSNPVTLKGGIYVSYIKRIIDLLVAVPAFLLLAPLNCIFAICTYFDVGKPILFKQTRIGLNNTHFDIVKFRNMTNDVDEDGILLPAKDRVTKFGKFMRKYSLDELLNFWSVIKGDMSIIGPRPLPVTFVERMSDRHKMRSAVRPGLECPRILSANPLFSQYENQFENDIWYVENVSFLTDIKMLLLLFKMTFDSKYRSKTAEGASYFVGYDENGKATSFKQYCKDHPGIMDKLTT